MKRRIYLLLLPVIILLSACSSAVTPTQPVLPAESPVTPPTETITGTKTPETPAETVSPEPGETIAPGYPEPGDKSGDIEMETGYPNPSDNHALPLDSAPWTAYPPVQSDANLERGAFFVDHIELQAVPGAQGATGLFVEGSLPTPCHAPRAFVSQPDENNRISVELYSVSDPNRACTQVIVPFSGAVAKFSNLPPGDYQVIVEGRTIGHFTAQ